MNLFSNVRYYGDRLKTAKRKLDEIVVSRKHVIRGFVFVVEKSGKMHLLVNANDYHAALSQLPSYAIDTINLSGSVLSVPVIESEEKAMNIQTGVFLWASRLG